MGAREVGVGRALGGFALWLVVVLASGLGVRGGVVLVFGCGGLGGLVCGMAGGCLRVGGSCPCGVGFGTYELVSVGAVGGGVVGLGRVVASGWHAVWLLPVWVGGRVGWLSFACAGGGCWVRWRVRLGWCDGLGWRWRLGVSGSALLAFGSGGVGCGVLLLGMWPHRVCPAEV